MQLHRREKGIRSQDAAVIFLTFNQAVQAQAWRRETGVEFPILLDPDCLVYKAYETERSLSRSWNLNTILEYARLMLSGRRWRGIQGDSAQLGADLILDRQGIIRMAYYSADPTDRPPVDQILDVLSSLPDSYS